MTPRPVPAVFASLVVAWAAVAAGQDRGSALYESLKRPVPAAEELHADSKPPALAKARHRAAAIVYNATLRRILEPSTAGVGGIDFDAGERLTRWSRRTLEAGLDQVDADDDRSKALDEEVAYIRKLEATLKPLAERPGSAISIFDLNELEFYRLEVLTRRARLNAH